MAEALVLRLRSITAGPEVESIIMDAHGGRLGSVSVGTLAAAAAQAGDRTVLVLVPGTEVVLARPEVPVKSGPRVVQAVPFALEEQIAGDVEDMHFAVGRRDAGIGVPVAGLARTAMDRLRADFAAAGLTVEAVYSEAAAVPVSPTGVTLLIEQDRVYVRRAQDQPVALDVQPLKEALQLALAPARETREHVVIYIGQSDFERDRELIESLRETCASVQVKLLPDGALPLLASCAVKDPPVNLLQGAYASKRQLGVSLAPWRYAAMLLAGLVVTSFVVKGVEFWQLARTEKRLDAEIAQVFARAMPGTRQVDARAQMQQRYMALAGGGGSGLLANLESLGTAMAAAPQTRLEALAYRNRVLDLRLLAPSVQSLDDIRNRVMESGFNAEIQSASPRDDNVEGRLQVKAPGA
jgi:general secretion pathway protein L